jgi:predicted transcriptional regulator of viral defense system
MKEQKETIKRLKLLPGLFRKQDVEKLTPHASMLLSRAVKKGLIHRINRGNYINSFLYGFPRIEEVACFLRQPAYVSCEWALNFHGITLQSPTVCTVVTLSTSVGRRRNILYQGVTIEFSKISGSLFFGFNYLNNMYIASPEKAILDTLYYRGDIPAGDELELDRVDFDLLSSFAGNYPQTVSRSLFNIISP